MFLSYKTINRKIIIKIRDRICETPDELLASPMFKTLLKNSIKQLETKGSPLLEVFGSEKMSGEMLNDFIEMLKFLTKIEGRLVPNVLPAARVFLKNKHLLNEFVEYVYNYWRSFDRFIICDSTGSNLDKKPYRTFNNTIEQMMHLIRAVYRDIQENITDVHPSVYRQVRAGAEVATIALPKAIPWGQGKHEALLRDIPVIRQVLLYPPLILEPPMNKRSGVFARVDQNPLDDLKLDTGDWLCYPAKVGELVILVYFHEKFAELGFSLSNLFEVATDEDLARKPDAVYLFGAPIKEMKRFGEAPTIFYEDEKNDLLIAAVPDEDRFGYFGYLKKMVLTLHNIKMMKSGRMPFHGALVSLVLKGNKTVNVLLIGDTGAGKSETLEAVRTLGDADMKDMVVIADDMGSLTINKKGEVIGYGTEIGAFLRLDDLNPGYAYGQIDRAIIMSPSKVNARIVLPVTSFNNVIKGVPIHAVLYANNYEEVDQDHALVERIDDVNRALAIFRDGTVMSKGTTTSSGIVHSYFANVFGPTQYRSLHEEIASKFFKAFYKKNVFVAQMRTRLGIDGQEQTGPMASAKALLEVIKTLDV